MVTAGLGFSTVDHRALAFPSLAFFSSDSAFLLGSEEREVAESLNLGKAALEFDDGELEKPGLPFSFSKRDTLVTESLGRPSMISLSLFSLMNLTLLFEVGFRCPPNCSIMGELERELALSNEEGEEDVGALSLEAGLAELELVGELGPEDLELFVLSEAFSTDR